MRIHKDLIFDRDHLANKIKKGSAALFPTDTLPALGILPENAKSLWELKKRPFDKPFVLMGASKDELLNYVMPSALEDATLVAKRYWPGALTIVVPSSSSVVKYLNKEENTIGLRVPALKEVLNLLSLTGPLATTSANISGDKSSKTALEASSIFPGLPILGPTPWPVQPGIASTVIYWQSRCKWQILRQGGIPFNINSTK